MIIVDGDDCDSDDNSVDIQNQLLGQKHIILQSDESQEDQNPIEEKLMIIGINDNSPIEEEHTHIIQNEGNSILDQLFIY